MRPYQTEDDYWRIRNFLRQIFLLNQRHIYSWPVARLDYWRWHGIMNLGDGCLETGIYLWETTDGEIAAVLNQEEHGQVFLQIHPAYKTADLEEQMIIRAEEKLRAPSRTAEQVLWIWSDSGDTLRQGILQQRGFTHISAADEHQWLRSLDLPIPKVQVRRGYAVRSLGDSSELPSRSWASWRAFHSDQPDENYDGDHRWYLNIQNAPLYRRDLDLVAISPSGEVAAFTTIWYDDVTRCGCFEPVGTMPEHQRLGLARSLMYEGLHRLKTMGATLAMTTGGSVVANALYQAVLGPVSDVYQPWEKRWPSMTDKPINP
ncbi:MAG: GNAT family N-acetyltransferase [Acidobacteriaceae bacterium]